MLKSLVFTLLATLLTPAAASISDHLASIKSDPNALYAFFKEMPKGGELHYHLDGGAYAETMLALAAQHPFCLNKTTFAIQEATSHCDGVTATELPTQQALYTQTIRAWSMSDFTPIQESSHDHFHAVFPKITPLESHFRPQLLAEVMQRAANQHELYMEIYLSADNGQSTKFTPLINTSTNFTDKQHVLLSNPDFQNNITYTINESKHILEQARKELHCDSSNKQPACDVTVMFQYYVLREQSLDNVFAQALTGFAAAAKSPNIVGVNLVQVEDHFLPLRDYRKQMNVFKFLHTAYPNVHIALHAGEQSPEAVRPKDLRFHIHDAITTGHAERIGHGVDIAYEDHAEALLDKMRTTPVPVEINLTSNRVVLNVSGKQHPLRLYLSHHVPVVLSTDDEGILRTDLTRQYVDAVINHDLNYAAIALINRNALTYGFLPGKSIWANAEKQVLISDCQDLTSLTCQKFISHNPKAKLQWQLEHQLAIFEKRF